MVHAEDREAAVAKFEQALEETRISGIETNLRYLRDIARWTPYLKGGVAMRDMADFSYTPHTIDVVSAGTMTTVQDWPGRVGYWEVGVPPCGPFDSSITPSGEPACRKCRRHRRTGNHHDRADPALQLRDDASRWWARQALMLKNGEPVAMNEAHRDGGGRCFEDRPLRRRRRARLSCGGGRDRVAGVSGELFDIHVREIRRAVRTRAFARGCAWA